MQSPSRRDAMVAVLGSLLGLGIGYLDLQTTEVTSTVLLLMATGLLLGLLQPRRVWRWAVLLAAGLPVMAVVGRALAVRTAEPIQFDPRIVLVAAAFALVGSYLGVVLRHLVRPRSPE